MSRNLLNKYIWLLETIERHGHLSRAELNDLWLASDISGGGPLARRTFSGESASAVGPHATTSRDSNKVCVNATRT